MRVEVWLLIPDLHFPFHDLSYLKIITPVLKMLAPTPTFAGMAQLGDFIDCWQLSDYDKDPARIANVVDDLLMYGVQLDEWMKILPPGAFFYQLEGNHEDRLRRYVWRRAPDLVKLIRSFPEILKFPERNREKKVNFKWFDISRYNACRIGDVALHHGHFFNKHVAVTNLDRYHLKLVHGHTHRVQYASNGKWWSASLGHGSDEEQTAHQPVPQNWQQAFGVLTVVDGVGDLEIVLVNNGKCTFRGVSICPSGARAK